MRDSAIVLMCEHWVIVTETEEILTVSASHLVKDNYDWKAWFQNYMYSVHHVGKKGQPPSYRMIANM